MAIAETITEINGIINDLKTMADAGDTLDGADKTAMETRIAHLRDKTQPQGATVLTDDLTDLQTKATIGKKAVIGLGWKHLGER